MAHRALAMAVVAAAALAGPPARAQEQVCRGVEGGRPVCADAPEAVVRRVDRELKMRGPASVAAQPGDAEVAARAQPYITKKQQKLVEAVARAMLAGRCDKAETLALRAGDHALAEEAVRRCIPAPRS